MLEELVGGQPAAQVRLAELRLEQGDLGLEPASPLVRVRPHGLEQAVEILHETLPEATLFFFFLKQKKKKKKKKN